MPKFTFKKTIHTGRWKSFETDHTSIKLKKKEIGYIAKNRDDGLYSVHLAIKKEKTERDSCDFKWIRLKGRFETEQTARWTINKFADEIQNKFDLHYFED